MCALLCCVVLWFGGFAGQRRAPRTTLSSNACWGSTRTSRSRPFVVVFADFQSVQGTISTQNTCHAQDQPKTRDPEPRHRIRPKPNHQTYLCPTSETLNPRCKRLKRGSGEQVSEELLQHKLKTFVEEADMEQAMSGALLPRPPPLAARLPSFSVCTSRVPCVLWPVCVTSDLWAA